MYGVEVVRRPENLLKTEHRVTDQHSGSDPDSGPERLARVCADLALGKLQAVTPKNLGQGYDSELWAYGSDWL